MGRFSRFDITEIEVEWNGGCAVLPTGRAQPRHHDSTPSLLSYGGFGFGL